MKDKIYKIYNSYLEKDPSLKNETVVLFIEGLGAYQGKARKECVHLHKKGRMGALFAVIRKDVELFYTSHASTLPDEPMGTDGKFNTGTPIPTIYHGVYDVWSHLHRNKYPAMEVGRGSEEISVIRSTGEKLSAYINIHGRAADDDEDFAWSTGCITVLQDRLNSKLEQLGVTSYGKYLGKHYVGKLIVDRSYIDKDLQKLYQDVYGQHYYKVFNTNQITELDYYKQQVKEQQERIKELTKDLFNRDLIINEQQEQIKNMKAKAKEIGEM